MWLLHSHKITKSTNIHNHHCSLFTAMPVPDDSAKWRVASAQELEELPYPLHSTVIYKIFRAEKHDEEEDDEEDDPVDAVASKNQHKHRLFRVYRGVLVKAHYIFAEETASASKKHHQRYRYACEYEDGDWEHLTIDMVRQLLEKGQDLAALQAEAERYTELELQEIKRKKKRQSPTQKRNKKKRVLSASVQPSTRKEPPQRKRARRNSMDAMQQQQQKQQDDDETGEDTSSEECSKIAATASVGARSAGTALQKESSSILPAAAAAATRIRLLRNRSARRSLTYFSNNVKKDEEDEETDIIIPAAAARMAQHRTVISDEEHYTHDDDDEDEEDLDIDSSSDFSDGNKKKKKKRVGKTITKKGTAKTKRRLTNPSEHHFFTPTKPSGKKQATLPGLWKSPIIRSPSTLKRCDSIAKDDKDSSDDEF